MLSFLSQLFPKKSQPLIQKSSPTPDPWDDVETYFECVTSCDLDDKECESSCVDELRNGNENTGTS